MLKRMISVFLIMVIISFSVEVFGYDRREHDEHIEYVLFENKDYKNSHPKVKSTIQALEDAAYLCIDQYNVNGVKELRNLVENEKIPGIPNSIDDINFSAGPDHRKYTHLGWNHAYDNKELWEKRRTILRNTVKAKLFSADDKPLSWIPGISNLLYENENQCESFCILLYSVHLLGDYIDAGADNILNQYEPTKKSLESKKTSIKYILPLGSKNNSEDLGLIPSIKSSCEILFASQSKTATYRQFMQQLDLLTDRANSSCQSNGSISTEDEFASYTGCAQDLLEILGDYVPRMLRKEEFFKNTFYK